MCIEKTLVESFYFEVWNKRNHREAHAILADDFMFRGSLGDEKKGVDGFLEYVDAVHTALGDYECVINDLVVDAGKVAARMTFQGIHQDIFFGVKPTHKKIEWGGAAFFEVRQSKIQSLWVLGDIDSIKSQLARIQ